MTLIDTHCHLDLHQFDPDRAAVLERAARAGVERILVPGIHLDSSRAVVQLAASHHRLYAAIGVHPTEAGTWNNSTRDELRALVFLSPIGRWEQDLAPGQGGEGSSPSPLGVEARDEDSSPSPLGVETRDEGSSPSPLGRGARGEGKILAIGEIGLDYYWDSAPHDTQKAVLWEQLTLAAELGLPVILHMRESEDAMDGNCAADLLQMLEKWLSGLHSDQSPLADRPGVLHSFSGSLETASATIQLGFFIGVTGPVTFENARRRQEIVAKLPLERLLIETDAPFLAPHPHRGKRNEPSYLRLIADKIAMLHACSFDTVAKQTSENACKLFAWKDIT